MGPFMVEKTQQQRQTKTAAAMADSTNANDGNAKPSPSSSAAHPPSIYHALLAPQRMQALENCDRSLLTYDPNSFWMIFRFRGRHFSMIAAPLVLLLLWDVAWALLLVTYSEKTAVARDTIRSMETLISPLLVPVSFLLVFRLGRAAVRYWDARAAMGKLVEVCRTTASTALVGLSFSLSISNGSDAVFRNNRAVKPLQNEITLERQRQQQHQLAEDIVRWIAVFPVAAKNFLRPFERSDCNRTLEIENVLGTQDLDAFLSAKGNDRYAPILVLNRLRQLAYEASRQQPSEALEALVFRQLNEQIDVLTGAWGAMERINGTPLPFVYVVHLRTFLVLYLLLWHMEAIASQGWIALIPLMLASWGLLGIEAASVECERPFHWHSNHLALGKACLVVTKNLAQTMENTGWAQVSMSVSNRPAQRITEQVETAQDGVKMVGTLRPSESSNKEPASIIAPPV